MYPQLKEVKAATKPRSRPNKTIPSKETDPERDVLDSNTSKDSDQKILC